MALPDPFTTEWLETDGLGGFAMGTAAGVRTRRYHALLCVARTPPVDRVVLVDGCDVTLHTASGEHALSSQRYATAGDERGVLHPDGLSRLASFTAEPWPTWTYVLPDGTRLRHELFLRHDASLLAMRWRLETPRTDAILRVRPFLSGRDYHALHQENAQLDLAPQRLAQRLRFATHPGLPAVIALASGDFEAEPLWYRTFLLSEERARGFDAELDLAAPGVFRFDLSQGPAVLLLAADRDERALGTAERSAHDCFAELAAAESERRAAFASPLLRAADAYLVRRGEHRTIVAGYPWFTDWGRDTFLALRGLCLATDDLATARDVLLAWATQVRQGMLPNRFLDSPSATAGDAEFNAVDASLWFVLAADELVQRAGQRRFALAPAERTALTRAVLAILEGYARGTRFGIAADDDGLLRAGEPGVQLTWMDARAGDRVVTPRIGKPVEVQALWVNALSAGARLDQAWLAPLARARAAFVQRFWNAKRGCLYDVVDADHIGGRTDATLRPNQILAAGGLPLLLLDAARARRVVDRVERQLLTPLGLRSLAPGEAGYAARYEGGPIERDTAYHNGTVWPWLLGPFVEAWVRVRGSTAAAKVEARQRFLTPLLVHLEEAGLGHVSEIADAEPPHTPRGCPFQAWSLGELLRLDRVVLAVESVQRLPRGAVA